ncbi:MAG TPA: methylmalonyl Co-A mutase-associated GTPase MeaB [Flavobacteriales bacterium]
MTASPAADLFQRLRQGDRSALARAITLVESTRADEQAEALALLRLCLPHSHEALRIGVTGIPGVGKSTLIDALGVHLVETGHRVAVLAIDPSSQRSGGSILGDKTRMERLSVRPEAFIRPTAAAGTLGGVARRTRETIVLCAAAGYGRILVETVGVGQGELAVDRMTDLNLLLMIPGAGDELQGIKRGIMESADLIALTKADGNAERHARTAAELRQAITLLPPRPDGHRPAVLSCSALTGAGIPELAEALTRLAEGHRSSGHLTERRREQDRWWLHSTVEQALIADFRNHSGVGAALADMEHQVGEGSIDPFNAAEQLMRLYRKG